VLGLLLLDLLAGVIGRLLPFFLDGVSATEIVKDLLATLA
jgi:hypothetical protein